MALEQRAAGERTAVGRSSGATENAAGPETDPVPIAPYVMLSELLENPELLQPPPVVLPRLVWEKRVTLVASEEKKGKSTLAGQAVTALTRGMPFLGEPTTPRAVLWACLDEPKEDLVRRLNRFGACDGVAILTERPALGPLRGTIQMIRAGLLVIDTLTEWAIDEVEDFNAAEGWTRLLRGLRQLAQETDCGILLLHHVNRSSGKYRGSGQIGAGVDAIVEMTEDPEDATVRTLKSRGRVVSETFKLRWDGQGGYRLEGAPPTLEERVLGAVQASPGVSQTGLRKAVGGRAEDVGRALNQLLERGLLVDVGTKSARKYETADRRSAQLHAGQGRDRVGQGIGQGAVPQSQSEKGSGQGCGDETQLHAGQGRDRVGQGTGQPLLSAPPIRGDAGQGAGGNLERQGLESLTPAVPRVGP